MLVESAVYLSASFVFVLIPLILMCLVACGPLCCAKIWDCVKSCCSHFCCSCCCSCCSVWTEDQDSASNYDLMDHEHEGLCSKLNILFPVYRIVFRQTVKEVVTHHETSTDTTKTQEFLFGGYRNPKHNCRLHTYFLTMLVIVLNWFLLMLCDTAIYRKTTTCNDINVRRDAYMCFDVSKSVTAVPVDCTNPDVMQNDNIHVLCYLKSFNIATALSLAFSFAQLIILLIHISFSTTLWCVKKYVTRGKYFALALHIFLCVVYIIICAVYGILIGIKNNFKYSEGENLFYGDKVLRIAMFAWCGVTIFFLTFLSPYCWLINRKDTDKEHYPTFSHA